MTEESPRMQLVITLFSMIPLWIYLVVALLLSVVAIVSLYDAVLLTLQLVTHPNLGIGIIDVVRSLLLTITVIVLLETVTVYFRTKHVPVRALLVAGLTGMIRQILVLNTADIDPARLLALVAVMAVLIAGVILVRDDEVQKS